MQCTCHGCPPWHSFCAHAAWHCKQKKCSMVDICDLEHMFEHLGAENEFKHCVLNHMDMETDNWKCCEAHGAKPYGHEHEANNVAPEAASHYFPIQTWHSGFSAFSLLVLVLAIWWHCVSLPLPGFLGWLQGDLLDVWLQALEDCSELVLVHFNHELIVGAPGFGAKAMHHGATHINLHNHVHGLLGCLVLLGILIAYAFSIWCRHQRHGQSIIPFGFQSLEQCWIGEAGILLWVSFSQQLGNLVVRWPQLQVPHTLLPLQQIFWHGGGIAMPRNGPHLGNDCHGGILNQHQSKNSIMGIPTWKSTLCWNAAWESIGGHCVL